MTGTSRRGFLAGAGGLIAAAPLAAWPAPAVVPVCAIHGDQPWLDRTGAASPYRPAPGTRGGAAAAALDEASFRRAYFYA